MTTKIYLAEIDDDLLGAFPTQQEAKQLLDDVAGRDGIEVDGWEERNVERGKRWEAGAGGHVYAITRTVYFTSLSSAHRVLLR